MLNRIAKLEKYEFPVAVFVSVVHITLELAVSLRASIIFTLTAVAVFSAYLILRYIGDRSVRKEWGFRADNLKASIVPYLLCLFVGFIFLYVVGLFTGGIIFSNNLLIGLAVYPFWGIGQQFVLQNFVVRHLAKKIASPLLVIFLANVLFALSHSPKFLLGGLAFLVGIAITFIYRKYPNLWLAGIVHGWLATLALYWVFQLDFLKIFF